MSYIPAVLVEVSSDLTPSSRHPGMSWSMLKSKKEGDVVSLGVV